MAQEMLVTLKKSSESAECETSCLPAAGAVLGPHSARTLEQFGLV